jgi:hypothetical protein
VRSNIVPGGSFTVYALPDHTGPQAHEHERMRTEMP